MIKSAYILSGGKSSRMGVDKGLLYLKGKRLIERQKTQLEHLGLRSKVVTNNTEYEELGFDCIPDRISNSGPLAGIYSALMDAQEDAIMVLGVDELGVENVDFKKLLDFAGQTRMAVVFKDSKGIQPLVGVYTKSLLPALKLAIENRELSVKKFASDQELDSIPFSGEIQNCNKPNDLDSSLVEVSFFGMIEEFMGCKSINALLPNNQLDKVSEFILELNPKLSEFTYQIAVNRIINGEIDTSLSLNKISIFPPFAGG